MENVREGRKEGPNPAVGDLVMCPFNSSHVHPAERAQIHLVRCKQQHPHHSKVTCRFNAIHLVDKKDIAEHEKSCPDRGALDSFLHEGGGVVSHVLKNDWNPDPVVANDDEWDLTPVPVLKAIKENSNRLQFRPRVYVGKSRADRARLRETNAQIAAIERARRGDDVTLETLRVYEHRVPIPPHVLAMMEAKEQFGNDAKELSPDPSAVYVAEKPEPDALCFDSNSIARRSLGQLVEGHSLDGKAIEEDNFVAPHRSRGRGRGLSIYPTLRIGLPAHVGIRPLLEPKKNISAVLVGGKAAEEENSVGPRLTKGRGRGLCVDSTLRIGRPGREGLRFEPRKNSRCGRE